MGVLYSDISTDCLSFYTTIRKMLLEAQLAIYYMYIPFGLHTMLSRGKAQADSFIDLPVAPIPLKIPIRTDSCIIESLALLLGVSTQEL